MLKKLLSGVLALTMAASFAAVSASAELDKGDVDGSGVVDIEDVANLINHINGVKALSDEALAAADMNADGTVDIEDAVYMINSIIGVSPETVSKYESTIYSFEANSNWSVEKENESVYSLNYVGPGCPEGAEVSFMFTAGRNLPGLTADSLKAGGDLIIDNYKKAFPENKYTINKEEKTTFNGYDAYRYDIVSEEGDVKFDIQLIVAKDKGDNLLSLMVYSDVDYTAKLSPEIQKVIDSLRFNS